MKLGGNGEIIKELLILQDFLILLKDCYCINQLHFFYNKRIYSKLFYLVYIVLV